MSYGTTARALSRRSALAGLGTGALSLALANSHLASAQEASPVPPPDGHLAAGTWRCTNYPGLPDSDTTFTTLMPDGLYVDASSDRYVTLGEWRASGDRIVQIAAVTKGLIPFDALFASGDVVVPRELFLQEDVALWRFTMTIDATGDHARLNGTAEIQDANGDSVTSFPYFAVADRMKPAADATATPTA